MAYGHTIAAISTPSGKGGVALIRISGNEAVAICESIFTPRGSIKPQDMPRVQIYGDILRDNIKIDDGMATYFPAPKSYTGEDVIEISCHGGILVTRLVLEAALMAGAHPAEAGEFTKRAYINGRLSLTEAESIGELLEAKSIEQIRLTASESRGHLARKIDNIRRTLTEILSSTFARIDYPDEDLGEYTDEESSTKLKEIRSEILSLTSTYPTGKAITEGIKTVICGRPNVGKSTLYNAILGEDAAIVTDIEGTTRDVLTSTVPLGRVMLRLSDTAGVRSKERAEAVERIGIERSLGAIEEAELIISVFDASHELTNDDLNLIEIIKKASCAKIAIFNKSDIGSSGINENVSKLFDKTITTSLKCGDTGAIEALSKAVSMLFTDEKIKVGNDAVVSSARHNAALTRALASVEAAINAYTLGVYTDAAASEVESALSAIAEIDGRAVSEEVVSDIFSKFCVGK